MNHVERILNRDRTSDDYKIDGAYMLAESLKGIVDPDIINRHYQQLVINIEMNRKVRI